MDISNTLEITEDVLKRFLSLPKKHRFEWCLTKSFPPLSLESTTQEIQNFIDIECGRRDKYGNPLIKPGGRHAYFRAIRCFFNWAYSPASGLGFEPSKNPITWVVAPDVPKRKMPAQNEKTVEVLMSAAHNKRDQAIISTFIDTGGRRAEVANIREGDISWEKHNIKAIAKGDREVYMPMGPRTEQLIKEWLVEYHPPIGGNIWGLRQNGIVIMLRRLEKETGIKCNAHTFRRGFACIQRRNGVDSLDIMELGHWKSHRMVQHYTEDVNFEDAFRHYIPPSSQYSDNVISHFTEDGKLTNPPDSNMDIILRLSESLGAAKERIKQLEKQILDIEVNSYLKGE